MANKDEYITIYNIFIFYDESHDSTVVNVNNDVRVTHGKVRTGMGVVG